VESILRSRAYPAGAIVRERPLLRRLGLVWIDAFMLSSAGIRIVDEVADCYDNALRESFNRPMTETA